MARKMTPRRKERTVDGDGQADATRPADKQSDGNRGATNATPNAKLSTQWDIQLHVMCVRWIHAPLELLQSKPMVVVPDYDVALTAEGYSATLGANRPDLRQTVDAYVGDLTGQAEFLELAELVFGTPELAAGLLPIITPPSVVTRDQLSALWRVCRIFLLEYVTLNNALSFEKAPFEHVYAQLQEYLSQPGPFASEWLLHLSNLSIEPNRVDLEEGLALRQVPQDERIWLIKLRLQSPLAGWFTHDVLAVLEYKDVEAKWSSHLQVTQAVLNTANTVVIALRLLKAQPVGLTGYHWQPVDQPFVTFPRHYTALNFNLPPMTYVGDRYVLTSGDADTLVTLWLNVQRALSDNMLKVALTRLEDSYHRTKDEDRLIDYWTALESLFLPRGSGPAQQGLMVAAVLAHYVGATASERDSIVSILIESHRLRNTIIHADKMKRPDKIKEMVTKTGTYLREALRKRIQE